MNHRIISIILGVVLVAAACGGGDADEPGAPEPAGDPGAAPAADQTDEAGTAASPPPEPAAPSRSPTG